MGTTMDRRSLLRAGAVLAGSGAIATAGGTAATESASDNHRVAVGFVIGAPGITGDGGTVRVGVPLLTQGRRTTVHTRPVSEADAMAITASVTEGVLVDFVTSGRDVVVARNATDTFHTVLNKGANPVFVTQKYGPELARRDGVPGLQPRPGEPWSAPDHARRADARRMGQLPGEAVPGSIEALGPPKPGREGGVRDVRVRLVDGGHVLHGFDKAQNVNPRVPLLANGIAIGTDSFVHDPGGWYVQFELDVQDSYRGFLPGVGPVESIRPGGAEVLRTQRFATEKAARAVARGVRAGRTYLVDLTAASAIAVPADGSPVFRAVR